MKYYLKKVSGFLITIALVALITFSVFQILPGNPALVILGLDADPVQLKELEEMMNLDKTAFERFFIWVQGVFSGDLGVSYRYKQPVSDLIQSGFKVTASLSLVAMIFTISIGLIVGVFVSKNSESAFAKFISSITQIGISVPVFCMGILLISIFTIQLNWFTSFGYTDISNGILPWLSSLILPAFSISIGASATLIRYLKVSVINQSKQDYVKTAKSKGLDEKRIMNRHILRNSLIPVITILGILTADILGGSIIVENVFNLPGIGKLISTAIETRDLPLIQGLTLYLALIVVFANFLVDILYSVIDPRIRKN